MQIVRSAWWARTRFIRIVLAIALVLGGLVLFTQHTPDATKFPLPAISSSRYLNAAPSVNYVGSGVCAECHPRETSTYQQSGHSRAFAHVDPGLEPKGDAFSHATSGREYRVDERGEVIYHTELMRGADGNVLASSEFPVRFTIGSGRHTRSYLIEDDGYLVQSPITWYASTKRWGLSPGYDTKDHWGFGRMIGTDCLTCHTGTLDTVHQRYRKIGIEEQTIGCERCHGPGSLHVERHRQGVARGEEDLTIVHPDSLSRAHLEAVCGQCHLQSAAFVRVRGRNPFDFRPGLPLTDFWIDYQLEADHTEMTVTGHVEQLRLSSCYLESETLTCTTCHTMHDPPLDRPAFYKQKCLSCHTSEQCTAEIDQRRETSPPDNCVVCHMPTSKTEIPHIAFTHHRIAVHKDQHLNSNRSEPVLVPVGDISHLHRIDQERSLGLAYLQFSEKCDLEESARTARRKSIELLTSVYDRGLQDADTLVALSKLFVEQDNNIAEELAIRAVAARDVSVASRSEALFVIADICFKSGRLDESVRRLKELVELRRIYEDWFLLGTCHFLAGHTEMAIEAFKQARHINPFRPEVHQLLSRSYARLGNHAAASQHQKLQEALTASPRSK